MSDDIVGITSLNFAATFGKFQMSTESAEDYNIDTCEHRKFPLNFTVDDVSPALEEYLWKPHEIKRLGKTNSLRTETNVRMGHLKNTLLLQFTLFNDNPVESSTVDIAMKLPLLIKYYDSYGWEWGSPSPQSCDPATVDSVEVLLDEDDVVLTCEKEKVVGVLLMPKDSSNPNQVFSFPEEAGSTGPIKQNGLCLVNSVSGVGTMGLEECGERRPTMFVYDSENSQITMPEEDDKPCLDANHGTGPDVIVYSCHEPDNADYTHQQFSYNSTDGSICSLSNLAKNMCLEAKTTATRRACSGFKFSKESGCVVSLEETENTNSNMASGICSNLVVPANGETSIELLVQVDYFENVDSVVAGVTDMANNFGKFWSAAEDEKEEWWQNAFKVDNDEFSGWLPTLVTDDEEIMQSYYGGIASFLLNGHLDTSNGEDKKVRVKKRNFKFIKK